MVNIYWLLRTSNLRVGFTTHAPSTPVYASVRCLAFRIMYANKSPTWCAFTFIVQRHTKYINHQREKVYQVLLGNGKRVVMPTIHCWFFSYLELYLRVPHGALKSMFIILFRTGSLHFLYSCGNYSSWLNRTELSMEIFKAIETLSFYLILGLCCCIRRIVYSRSSPPGVLFWLMNLLVLEEDKHTAPKNHLASFFSLPSVNRCQTK